MKQEEKIILKCIKWPSNTWSKNIPYNIVAIGSGTKDPLGGSEIGQDWHPSQVPANVGEQGPVGKHLSLVHKNLGTKHIKETITGTTKEEKEQPVNHIKVTFYQSRHYTQGCPCTNGGSQSEELVHSG